MTRKKLLTHLLLLTSLTFSINVIAQNSLKRDTSITCIPTWQLKASAKELLAYDACKEELTIVNDQLRTVNNQFQSAMSVIRLNDEKEQIYKQQIFLYQNNENLYNLQINDLNRSLRKQRRKSVILGATGFTLFVGAGVLATYFAIIK